MIVAWKPQSSNSRIIVDQKTVVSSSGNDENGDFTKLVWERSRHDGGIAEQKKIWGEDFRGYVSW
jgi:hypothetical protein